MKILPNVIVSHPATSHSSPEATRPWDTVCLGSTEAAAPTLRPAPKGQEEDPIRDINRPGEAVDVESHLVPGKHNVVCFWATWCPWSQKAQPKLRKLCTERPEFVCRRVDIDNFESPVAGQYGITRVPAYRIYDGNGELVASGQEAFDRMKELFEETGSLTQ